MPSKGVKLGPIIIGVHDIEKAKTFYTNVFEIEIEAESPHYVSARLGDAHIELEEESPNRFPRWKERNVGTYKNSEFLVTSLEEFLRKVEAFGGKVLHQPRERPWGKRNAEIIDPDGNIFLISEM